MTAGKLLSKSDLWEEYYTTLLKAYNAMREAFKKSGLTQDQIAERLGVDKALVSKRLNTRENLTLKTLSFMACAMGYRLTIGYTPYYQVEAPTRYYDAATPQGSTEQTDKEKFGDPLPKTIKPDGETEIVEVDPHVTLLAA